MDKLGVGIGMMPVKRVENPRDGVRGFHRTQWMGPLSCGGAGCGLRVGLREDIAGSGPCPPPARGSLPKIGPGQASQSHSVFLVQRFLEGHPPTRRKELKRPSQKWGISTRCVGRVAARAKNPPGAKTPHDLLRIIMRVGGVDPFPLCGQAESGAAWAKRSTAASAVELSSASASAGRFPDGTKWSASPRNNASAPDRCAPVSAAWVPVSPGERDSRRVPPTSGTNPMVVSGMPVRVRSVTTRTEPCAEIPRRRPAPARP